MCSQLHLDIMSEENPILIESSDEEEVDVTTVDENPPFLKGK